MTIDNIDINTCVVRKMTMEMKIVLYGFNQQSNEIVAGEIINDYFCSIVQRIVWRTVWKLSTEEWKTWVRRYADVTTAKHSASRAFE